MAIKYPSAIDDSSSIPVVVSTVSKMKASDVNNLRSAILAIEQELGTNPSGANTTVSDRMSSLEGLLTGFAPDTPSYLVLTSNVSLQNERVFSVANRLTKTDGGAGNSLTLDLNTTAVSAGTYSFATITVDQYGRATFAEDGDPGWVYDGSDIINTNVGNVGIGGTPDAKLDVHGDFSLREVAAPTTSAAGQAVIYLDSADGKLKASVDAAVATNLIQGAGVSNRLAYWSSDFAVASDSDFVIDGYNGFFGVGAAATEVINAQKNQAATSKIKITNTNTTSAQGASFEANTGSGKATTVNHYNSGYTGFGSALIADQGFISSDSVLAVSSADTLYAGVNTKGKQGFNANPFATATFTETNISLETDTSDGFDPTASAPLLAPKELNVSGNMLLGTVNGALGSSIQSVKKLSLSALGGEVQLLANRSDNINAKIVLGYFRAGEPDGGPSFGDPPDLSLDWDDTYGSATFVEPALTIFRKGSGGIAEAVDVYASFGTTSTIRSLTLPGGIDIARDPSLTGGVISSTGNVSIAPRGPTLMLNVNSDDTAASSPLGKIVFGFGSSSATDGADYSTMYPTDFPRKPVFYATGAGRVSLGYLNSTPAAPTSTLEVYDVGSNPVVSLANGNGRYTGATSLALDSSGSKIIIATDASNDLSSSESSIYFGRGSTAGTSYNSKYPSGVPSTTMFAAYHNPATGGKGILLQDGTAANPSLALIGNRAAGLFSSDGDNICISYDGAKVVESYSGGLWFDDLGSEEKPLVAFGDAVGFFRRETKYIGQAFGSSGCSIVTGGRSSALTKGATTFVATFAMSVESSYYIEVAYNFFNSVSDKNGVSKILAKCVVTAAGSATLTVVTTDSSLADISAVAALSVSGTTLRFGATESNVTTNITALVTFQITEITA